MKKNISGFTLVEAMITMTILTIAAVGITSLLISIQRTAQNSLHNSTALNVALSTLEQMKSADQGLLDFSIANDQFNLRTSDGTIRTLDLGQENDLQIPIVTRDPDNVRTLELTLIPEIRPTADNILLANVAASIDDSSLTFFEDINGGYIFEVSYRYEIFGSDVERTGSLKCMRSRIPTY